MTRRVIVIADDFTGATDIGGAFVETGRTVAVHLGEDSLLSGVPSISPEDLRVDVDVYALKSRSSSVEDAISMVDAAVRRASYQHDGDQLYFKFCSTFDSTSKGNIGPVLELLQHLTEARSVVVVPSFPDNGRTQYLGHLFVGEELLAESAMANHPITPMRDSSVPRLLRAQTSVRCDLVQLEQVRSGKVDHVFDEQEEDPVFHVVDAISNEDLVEIARHLQEHRLVSGGAGLAQNYPIVGPPAREEISPLSPSRRVTIVGSQSAATRSQLAFLRSSPDSEYFEIDPGANQTKEIERFSSWLSQTISAAKHMVVTRPDQVAGEMPVRGTAEKIEELLALAASKALESGVREFVVAGGETSGAVLRALGGSRLTIGPEICAGVPWCRATLGDGSEVNIALKSGNFGDKTFFVDAWKVLDK